MPNVADLGLIEVKVLDFEETGVAAADFKDRRLQGHEKIPEKLLKGSSLSHAIMYVVEHALPSSQTLTAQGVAKKDWSTDDDALKDVTIKFHSPTSFTSTVHTVCALSVVYAKTLIQSRLTPKSPPNPSKPITNPDS